MKIWDSFVRGYHWLLVLGIPAMWWTANEGHMEWHLRIGIGIGALLIARLIWALAGSKNARFSAFVKGPGAVIKHFRSLMSRQSYTPGSTHNPAGGWSVLLLWGLLAMQLGTGLFATDEIFFSGPLASLVSSDWQNQLTDLHRLNFVVLATVIAIHILAVLLYRLKGISLIAAMIHGKRDGALAPGLRWSFWAWLLAAVLAASGWYLWA
ncbi:cytochrome b/b6 domain-containing protein [Pseudidiomarina insulisalsae]|uniref:Cytochrome B n=1 Tax=Pseudidiomarina insulisalsae TaxID=575789 RepID=A0A432YHZ4_9GAMM|nr:cytochrome b/b6 domain-containing protein [Pseudidiomarina insulisalsae]RUO60573.1 cytochrome B [Pseudidiomarina insulisalsae]